MSPITIRSATLADVPGVLALWRTAAKGTSISDDERGVGALITRDSGALLLAETAEDGTRPAQLVGSVIAGFDGWRCHLYRLAVRPDHRRRGIARQLLAAAEERFRSLGGRRADAMVLRDNPGARRAWEAAGYRPDPVWVRWVRPL